MIALKESFIQHYLEKLNHKIEQELKEKLPDSGFLMNMIEQADSVVLGLMKYKEGK